MIVVEENWCQGGRRGRSMGIRMIGEDGVELSTMVRFSTMLKLVHITVQHLAVDSHPKATATWGLVLAMRPLRGSALISIVHAVNAFAKLILRLMLFSVIGGWKVLRLHARVVNLFSIFSKDQDSYLRRILNVGTG